MSERLRRPPASRGGSRAEGPEQGNVPPARDGASGGSIFGKMKEGACLVVERPALSSSFRRYSNPPPVSGDEVRAC